MMNKDLKVNYKEIHANSRARIEKFSTKMQLTSLKEQPEIGGMLQQLYPKVLNAIDTDDMEIKTAIQDHIIKKTQIVSLRM